MKLLGVLLILATMGLREGLSQTNYARAGWETHLIPQEHGVKGTATILDARTIQLTHFSYDGAGPDTYVYLGTNRTVTAFRNGYTASPRLTRSYHDETYIVQLPTGQTLDDWRAISIWCRAAQSSFGWGLFAPPVRPTLSVTRLTNAMAVTLTGEAGQNYWLQANTNQLDTNGWRSLVLLTNLTGTIRHTNSPATNRPGTLFRALRD